MPLAWRLVPTVTLAVEGVAAELSLLVLLLEVVDVPLVLRGGVGWSSGTSECAKDSSATALVSTSAIISVLFWGYVYRCTKGFGWTCRMAGGPPEGVRQTGRECFLDRWRNGAQSSEASCIAEE